ncbi:MAG: hypothetical protein ACOYNY_33125 [Caldilineaceae bacterium]
MKFAEWYNAQFRETLREPLVSSDGMSALEIDTALGGKSVPAAMRAYYSVAGKHWINRNHNHLRELSALETVGDYTIFMDEHQVVAQWAIRNSDLRVDDPMVFQGQQRGSFYEWYPEKYTFSAFMITMWRWILTGDDPE